MIGEEDLKKLLGAYDGRHFDDRRDMAMIRLLVATGMRAGELTGLRLALCRSCLCRGQGPPPPRLALRGNAAQALDRCLRMRRVHPHAASDWLWPGKKGGVTDSGLQQMVDRRATQAGVAHVHSHQLRHTYAHSFLAEGGNQGDLMMLAGWRPR